MRSLNEGMIPTLTDFQRYLSRQRRYLRQHQYQNCPPHRRFARACRFYGSNGPKSSEILIAHYGSCTKTSTRPRQNPQQELVALQMQAILHFRSRIGTTNPRRKAATGKIPGQCSIKETSARSLRSSRVDVPQKMECFEVGEADTKSENPSS